MGIWRLWWETAKGIFTTAPREHLSMLRQDSTFALRMMRKNLGFTIEQLRPFAIGISVARFCPGRVLLRGFSFALAPQPQAPQPVAQVQPAVATAMVPLSSAANDYLLAHQGFSPRVSLQGMAPYVRTVSETRDEPGK